MDKSTISNVESIEEEYFLKAEREFETDDRDNALYAKSAALSEGDIEKTKYKYISLRAEQLNKKNTHDKSIAEEADFDKKYITVDEYVYLKNLSPKKHEKEKGTNDLNEIDVNGIRYIERPGYKESIKKQEDVEPKPKNASQKPAIKATISSNIPKSGEAEKASNIPKSGEAENGGIGRLSYLILFIIVFTIHAFINMFSKEVGALFFIVMIIALTVIRFKNIGLSPWLAFVGLIPIICLYTYGQAFVLPEKYVENKTIDLSGKMALILYSLFWLMLLGFILKAFMF